MFFELTSVIKIKFIERENNGIVFARDARP